jgi:hypothetical protein
MIVVNSQIGPVAARGAPAGQDAGPKGSDAEDERPDRWRPNRMHDVGEWVLHHIHNPQRSLVAHREPDHYDRQPPTTQRPKSMRVR